LTVSQREQRKTADSKERDRDSEAAAVTAMATAPVEGTFPLHSVVRIMRRAAGPGVRIARDAACCMNECAAEMVLFVAQEAAERCTQESRRTLTAADVAAAMAALGFPQQPFLDAIRPIL